MGNRHTGGGGDVAAGDVGGDSAGDVDGVDVVDGVDDGDGDDATACSNPHRGWECNSPASTPRWVGIWDHCTKDRVRFQAPTAATRPLLVRRRCHARTIECQPDGPSGAPCARGVATTFQRTPFPPSGPQTVFHWILWYIRRNVTSTVQLLTEDYVCKKIHFVVKDNAGSSAVLGRLLFISPLFLFNSLLMPVFSA
ncbi:uncharacterized protein NPIL_213881 [Nephila pilipes]|uniref:Uncharacterized protein n=1 Tax=Nephila pilipes TaxID=299642 RepID=A0A8X6P6Q2_NEPPI|nr:uncharacterized protein NPIL_213881 [Nephila pilipes]